MEAMNKKEKIILIIISTIMLIAFTYYKINTGYDKNYDTSLLYNINDSILKYGKPLLYNSGG